MHQGDIFRNLKLFRTFITANFNQTIFMFSYQYQSTGGLTGDNLGGKQSTSRGSNYHFYCTRCSINNSEISNTSFTARDAYLVIVTLAIPSLLHQMRVSVNNVSWVILEAKIFKNSKPNSNVKEADQTLKKEWKWCLIRTMNQNLAWEIYSLILNHFQNFKTANCNQTAYIFSGQYRNTGYLAADTLE